MSLYYSLLILVILNYVTSFNGYYQQGRIHHPSKISSISNSDTNTFLLATNTNNDNNNNNHELLLQHEKYLVKRETNNNKVEVKNEREKGANASTIQERRSFLASSMSLILAAATTTSRSQISNAMQQQDENTLTKGVFEARWKNNDSAYRKTQQQNINDETTITPSSLPFDIPATFVTYASRIIVHYDYELFTSFLNDDAHASTAAASNNKNINIDGDIFGSFAMSVQIGLERFMASQSTTSSALCYESLANLFLEKYGTLENGNAWRHIGILFSLLPIHDQPIDLLQMLSKKRTRTVKPPSNKSVLDDELQLFLNDPQMLLPSYYIFVYDPNTKSFSVQPSTELLDTTTKLNQDQNINSRITTTPFGPRSITPLKRDRPSYNPYIYSLLALSGGISCAITHSLVIPLDVVKTRMQTDDLTKMQQSSSSTSSHPNTGMISYAQYIIETEGMQALLLGASATIAGFSWYGITVYPSYLFFKRFLSSAIMIALPTLAGGSTWTTIISLLSGALASVIASIGLTPLEACRIRTVAQPEKYASLGLSGTIAALSTENETLGYKMLYAGFPSLVTRQVIFGSIKFLTFERTCAYLTSILSSYAFYSDYTYLPFLISLISGGVAGSLSSVISQPADSVLTYVSKQGQSMGVIEGAQIMIEKDGVSSLYRGLGSRCLWASCIIAGQFCLYDVFRSLLGVSSENLSQVLEVVIGP